MSDGRARLLAFPKATDGIELRHMRSFVAVAEELNFRRAAERLYVTQPPLSRQIRSLERLVGSQLLRRSTHGAELTLAGEALLERARRLLRDVDDTVHAVQAIGGESAAQITLLWQPVEGQPGDPRGLQDQREAYEAMLAHVDVPAGVRVRPVTAGGVQALVVAEEPAEPPGVLYLHGGGFVFGSAFGYRPLAGALALASGTGVLVADYRLAPEHPFPAALDDGHAAYMGMLENGADPAQLVISGDSGGANLALALLLRLRDEGVPLPAGALLFCPVVDLSLASLGLDTNDPTHQTFIELARRAIDAYVAGHSTLDPLVSPMVGDLSGLPRFLIQAAGGDVMAGDARALHQRARAAGVSADMQLYPVDAHVFQLFWSFLPEAADAIDAAGRFVARSRSTPADVERAE